MTPRYGRPIAERFWEKVAPADADHCWLWTASLNTSGYGQFMLNGRPQRAHRIAYELLRAEIPDGLQIDHLCRVRRCVNPWHLDPVPNAVNAERARPYRAVRQLKQHCPSGHAYSPENTYSDPRGHRRCRECGRQQSLAAYYRRLTVGGEAA